MNADGYRDGRKVDYIQTPKGMGPVEEMMIDPKKALLLYGGQTDHPITVYDSPGFMLFPSVWYSGHDPEGNVFFYYSCPITATLLDRMKTHYASTGDMITLNYSDSSWLYNAKGDTNGNTQEGSITFQIKLPE